MNGINLPKQCGVLLLSDCTLFPHAGLPLNIFEQRYRKMLADALAGDFVFAIGQPIELDELSKSEKVVPHIGTAGLIRASREREDGTSELLLHGIIRVQFHEWIVDSPYPCAVVEPILSEPMEPIKALAATKTLLGAVEDAIAHLPPEVNAEIMNLLGQTEDPNILTDLITHQFIHKSKLRQKLLETVSIGDRVSFICDFFENLKNS